MSTVSSTSNSFSLSTTNSSALGTTHLNTTVNGLDIDALISATIQADSIPVIQLQNKNSLLQAQLSDYNTIRSALTTLQYAVTDLTYSDTYQSRTATSSNTSVVTAATSTGAANGTYTINVGSMATTTSNTSAAITKNANSTATSTTIAGSTGSTANVTGSISTTGGITVNNGSFAINGTTINVASTDSVSTIVSNINSSSAGVTAAVGSDGKITITSNTTGSGITLSNDTSGFLAASGLVATTSGSNTIYPTTALGNGSAATTTGSNSMTSILNQAIGTNGLSVNGTTLKPGTLYINGKQISVSSTDTINTIVNAISASSAGVTASIGSDGKITLTQNTVGSSNAITLGSDSTNFFAAAGITQAGVTAGVDSDETRTLNNVFGTYNSSTGTGIAAGYFSINGTFFSVDPTTDTIDSIINKINNSTTAGVLAFYNSTSHTISLTSQTAGNKDITLGTSSTDSSNFLAQIGLAQSNQKTGTNAAVTVNGVAVTPVNNQVTLNGNTFTITGQGTSTVTVANDVNSVVSKVQTFVSDYNAAMDAITSKMTEQPDSSSSSASTGDLFCDPTLEDINSQLRNYASAIVTSQSSAMQQLSQAGITTGDVTGTYDATQVQSGHLQLDTAKLTSALESNPNAVAALFGNSLVSVNNENVGTGDGSTTSYTLKHGSISNTPIIQTTDASNNITTYTLVSGTPQKYNPGGTPPVTDHEFSINYNTGQITFADAPASGSTITASYDYDVSSGSNAGLFVQMQTMLNGLTQAGGTFDTLTGSTGSITNQMTYNNNQISTLQDRLSAEQATLYNQYDAMQTVLSTIKSQGSYISALFSSLTSSSSG